MLHPRRPARDEDVFGHDDCPADGVVEPRRGIQSRIGCQETAVDATFAHRPMLLVSEDATPVDPGDSLRSVRLTRRTVL
jgi:hypothetical protein